MRVFKLWVVAALIALSVLIPALVSCGQRNNNTTSGDTRTTLSNSGVSVRVFDENGTITNNPSERYSLNVTSDGNSREVVIALKEETLLRSSYIEVQFNPTREHPSDIQCGSALLKYQPLVYMSSPTAGTVIGAQVITGNKACIASGELIRIYLVSGSCVNRSVSDFSQSPTTDPIIAETSVDLYNKNKVYWTFKFRGEANVNSVFDFVDFGLVGSNYGKVPFSTPSCEPADGNHNLKVDFPDFGVIGANYNKGISGLKVLRDDKTDPTTLLGTIGTNGKFVGTLTLDPTATGTAASGFKNYWYVCGGVGRYVKLVLIDKNGADVSAHFQIIDTQAPFVNMQGDWWMFGREQTHKQQSTFTGPTTNALKWTFTQGSAGFSSPALDVNGTIYIGGDNAYLYAINPSGSVKWSYKTGDRVRSSPAVGIDGTIYVGSNDSKLHAIKSDGTLKWYYKMANIVQSSPAIGPDGTIYLGSDDKNLYAINYFGSLKWTYKTGGIVYSSPAIGSDGTVYVGSEDTNLYALNPNGTLKWSYKTGGLVDSSPTIGSDGTIYVGSEDYYLYAINPDGKLKWSYKTGYRIRSTPAIANDGSIIFGSYDRNLYSLKPDGSLKWTYKTGGMIVTASPAIGNDGTVYIGSDDNCLYAINSDGTLKWLHKSTKSIGYTSPSIGSDGTVYVGCKDGNLYAIGPGNIK